MNRSALIRATLIGTVLQLAMVIAGHFVPAIAQQFAILGMLISLVAGLLYVRAARGGWGDSLIGGLIAGAVCAFLGILVSYLLKDVTVDILWMGTAGSAVAGLIGGAIGKLVFAR
ncbi:hypothetical protein GVN21_02965 [Caulobacter sp. SLTY]|uniref:hypothetical protein n=1 Tax=Caulobacter sp. SLTY TaxID=2683262 RepID=UPI001412985E|nr:hypothetical protein [Caulobacter sp. SLTY]NBB14315.1 hypothetical protein [Caulobacter sp. SLTY]